jgi:hypothetical protein
MNSINETDFKIRKELSQNDLCFYLYEVSVILQEYKTLLETPLKISFTGKSKNNNKKLESLVIEYLTIAQKYTENILDIPKKIENKLIVCSDCKNNDFDIVDNLYTCLDCGSEMVIGLKTSVSDTSCVNVQNKQIYDRLDTFNVVMETFPFNKDFDLITRLIKDFKLLDRVFTKTYYNKNFPLMSFVLYKLLLKNKYVFTQEISVKIKNKKCDILHTCFDILKWDY